MVLVWMSKGDIPEAERWEEIGEYEKTCPMSLHFEYNSCDTWGISIIRNNFTWLLQFLLYCIKLNEDSLDKRKIFLNTLLRCKLATSKEDK